MELLLIRHAEANSSQPDDARTLTERGERRTRACAGVLRALELAPTLIYHSPLTRARQTADLLPGESRVTQLLARAPGDELETFVAGLEGDVIALVGHEPWMSALCSLYLTGSTRSASALPFKKGAVAWLRGDPRFAAMALAAFMPPKIQRQIIAE